MVNGIKVMVVTLPPDWDGIPEKNLPGGSGIVNIWTAPGYNGRKESFSLYHYPDGTMKGRGIRKYRDIGTKAINDISWN